MIDFCRLYWRGFKHKWKIFIAVNWYKTLYFNFKKFPFKDALKLPVFFFGKVTFSKLSGTIKIEVPLKRAMITFGQKFELMTTSKGIGQFHLSGNLIFKGYTHIAKDCFLYVGENATCTFGNMSALGSDVKLICTNNIVIGEWTGIGYESQILDTNSHPMLNTETCEDYSIMSSIVLGDYNAISNRVSIMPGTKTSHNIVIASNSVLNKDYTNLGSEILIGGIPAKLIRENFARNWELEREDLMKFKIVRF